MIPKIIHYCWLSGDPIPESLKTHMKSWQVYLPDYEFVLWDLNRFDINQSLWVKQAFESKKYAFAADYIRLYAIYNLGGFYMDMDVEVRKSFNPLLNSPYVLGSETNVGIEAGVFGAEKGNKYIGECLERYTDREFIKEDGSFDMEGLPRIMYNIANKKYSFTERHSTSIDSSEDTLALFPFEYLTAKVYATGKVVPTKNTYTIHHFAGSWQSQSKLVLVRNKILQILRRILGVNFFTRFKK